MEQPKHVYLIDDDPDDRYLVCEAFTLVRPQDNIIEAINGHHFFEILDVNKVSVPSLIILDVNMPGMNGLETLNGLDRLF
ncbi:response regulator [Dyadobacter bucti]|uniref:response regulator n=1 Tax=Dyadobacter bucti TaxID=2572203 RepID=UPI0011083026|nr:response regulator [Dyadobacter bucti]